MSWNESASGSSAGPAPGSELVEGVEETRQRPNARSFASCSGKRRSIASAPIRPTLEPVVVLARGVVRAEELDAGDRVQLARALVEHQLDVAERLEPGAEARLRLADALGDRADPAAIERVEVEHTVGLAEAERAQHDRLGLVGAAGHRAKCRSGTGRESPDVLLRCQIVMAPDSDVHDSLVRLLRPRQGAARHRGASQFEEILLDDDPRSGSGCSS